LEKKELVYYCQLLLSSFFREGEKSPAKKSIPAVIPEKKEGSSLP